MKNSIHKEQFYNHPIEEVWHAISDEKAISTWFITANFKPEVGFKLKFTHEPSGTVVSGTVLEVHKPNTLVYTWIVNDTKVETTVKWMLREESGGTLLVLEHHGFADYKDTAVEMFESSVKGWEACLAELEKHLTGEAE